MENLKHPIEPLVSRLDNLLREAADALFEWDERPYIDGLLGRIQVVRNEVATMRTIQLEPSITKRELAFALNYHSDDARIGEADWKIADHYFEVIAANRDTHPSLRASQHGASIEGTK